MCAQIAMLAARFGHQSTSDRPGAQPALGRIDRIGRPLTFVLGMIALLSLVASVPLASAVHQGSGANLWLIPYAIVGAAIAYRQPRNAIGWIMLASGLMTSVCSDAGYYAALVYRQDDHLPLGRLGVALAPFWAVFIVLLPLPIMLFPDGHAPRGRWRSLSYAYVALCVAALVWAGIVDVGAFTDHRLMIAPTGELNRFDTGPAGAALVFPFFLIALVSVVYQVLRYRRSSGERRAQLKWMMSGGVVAVVGFVAGLALNHAASPLLRAVGGLGFLCSIALPLGMSVGILRYRLYEIDRIISRTLSYAAVTALLVGTFAGLIVLLTEVLPFSSTLGVAASTLAAAALFNPLRARVQRVVDSRFNRARYDAEATVDAFAKRLREAIDLDAVEADLLVTVRRALEPSHASVWIRGGQC